MTKEDKGFSAVVALIIIIVLLLVGFGGWYVWSKNNDDSSSLNQSDNLSAQQPAQETEDEDTEEVSNTTEGWTVFQGDSLSFSYPSDWKKEEILLYKSPVDEVVSGSQFGSTYSVKLKYAKDTSKWNRVLSDPGLPDEYIEAGTDEYTSISDVRIFDYPTIYGIVGEGGGVAHYIAVTNGNYSYLIELPVILEETDTTGFVKQKEALPEIIKSIKAHLISEQS